MSSSFSGGLEESSEGSEPDEVIDLSESEDDDHLEDVQGIRREEPSPSRKPLPALPAEKEEYSVNKPLPPLPPEDELEVKSGENREQEDDQPKLLPVLSIEEEEELEDTVTKPESSGEPTEKKRKISIQKSNSRTEIEIENSETKLEDDKCNESDTNRDTLKEDTKAENSTKTENEMSVGSKARYPTSFLYGNDKLRLTNWIILFLISFKVYFWKPFLQVSRVYGIPLSVSINP